MDDIQSRLEKAWAFQMQYCRCIVIVNWPDRVTNEKVLKRMEEKSYSNEGCLIEKEAYSIEHILRHAGLLKTIIVRRVEEKTSPGMPRKQFVSQYIFIISAELKKLVQNRAKWKFIMLEQTNQ